MRKIPFNGLFSICSAGDGSKYLYGNKININAGAIDDVQISLIQYKFTYNVGTGAQSVTAWTTPQNAARCLWR